MLQRRLPSRHSSGVTQLHVLEQDHESHRQGFLQVPCAVTSCVDFSIRNKWWTSTCDEAGLGRYVRTVVNNQLSGAGKVEIDLIDFLFKPSSYLYRFNSYPIGLDT
jgi:hypothetical protein